MSRFRFLTVVGASTKFQSQYISERKPASKKSLKLNICSVLMVEANGHDKLSVLAKGNSMH